MGYYCTVPQCTSLAGKTKNVKFHRFPRDVTMADKWNTILKRGKPYTKYSKVCSLHFTQADYNVTTMGQWKTLSKDAVPSQNLPRLNPDGTVMVIRKSRTVKCRDPKKEDGEQDMKWPAMAPTPAHASLLETTVSEAHDPHLAYRLQSLNTIASAVSPIQHNQGSEPSSRSLSSHGASQTTNPGLVKPKKQDAIMQTDPVQDDPEASNVNYDSSEKSYGSEQVDSFSQKDPLEPDYTEKQKYDTPKDYTKSSDDYIPQTNDEYNKEAEKYALERKSLGAAEYGVRYDDHKYRDGYLSYHNQYPDSVDLLRQQQVNMQLLQSPRADRQIKREDEEEAKYNRFKEPGDEADPLYERRSHQQRLLEQLQTQLKQEPDQNAHETVMQPQGSPFYQSNVHNNVPTSYYEVPLSRPGPELLIAKQNALAAHSQLWQNTMKRPFFYSETPQLLHRYEDFSRILQ